ncbi:hypothetical protein KLEB273_gp207 [Bacillus phage vB_BauM_KLEB27-3]|nr:hypothetical protein KLEB273_gp207 [Bacillus phage vB_BauM_KLEB27-3]
MNSSQKKWSSLRESLVEDLVYKKDVTAESVLKLMDSLDAKYTK